MKYNLHVDLDGTALAAMRALNGKQFSDRQEMLEAVEEASGDDAYFAITDGYIINDLEDVIATFGEAEEAR